MEYDQLWESVVRKNERELLQGGASASCKNGFAPNACVMNAQDIAIFIEITAQSHKCDPRDISYYYEPIIGDDGRVILNELQLVFNMKSLVDGVLSDRTIHTIRVAVPMEVQQRARSMLEKEKSDHPALLSTTSQASITSAKPARATTDTVHKPRTRKSEHSQKDIPSRNEKK